MKKYKVIYPDPPWEYKDKCNSGERGAEFKYPCMSMEELKALPVGELADEDCAMLCWATWPLLPNIFREGLFEAWGFTYRTIGFIWIKMIKSEGSLLRSNRLKLGMGNYSRSNSEPCLLATRGKPKRIDAGVQSVVVAPIGEHSAKPVEVHRRIERLFGDVPRIELFARRKRKGWDHWGNQVESDVELNAT